MPIDPVTLAQELVRFDTVNPPGEEEPCAAHLAVLLERSGFRVEAHAFRPGRTSLVARFPGRDRALARLGARLAPDAALDPALADLGPVGTDPGEPFVRCVREVVARHGGPDAATPAGMPYFTDGSVLQRAYGQCPTVIVGPGEPGQAHGTDEFCPVDAIARAEAIYRDVIQAWCEA